MSNKDIMCFQAEICQERYYNENSCWGVYTFKTQDEIKYFNGNPKEYISDEGKSTYYYSVLCGEMQQLFDAYIALKLLLYIIKNIIVGNINLCQLKK